MARMGFEKDNNKVVKRPLVADNFTNAICYGKTGSGKTSGFILPNIENRIKMGHGVLVYDFKGTMHKQVKAIAARYNKLEDVVEIGKPWGEKINIIKNLNAKQLKVMFSNIHGGSHEPFWANAAANLFISVYKIHLNFEQISKLESKFSNINEIILKSTTFADEIKRVSLFSIFNVVKSIDSLQNFFITVEKDIEIINNNITRLVHHNLLRKTTLKMAHYLKKIKSAATEIEAYKKLDGKADSVGGLYGVLDVLNSILSNVGTYEYINDDQFDIVSHLRNGKIVVIDLSSLDESLLGLLNLSIYQSLQKNNDKLNNCSVTIFVDEAQKVLQRNYLPDVDICRESVFEYIFATQDKVLLDSAIGQREVDKLLSNIVEQYSFATNKNQLQKFEYENLIDRTNKFAEPLFFEYKELFEIEHKFQNLFGVNSLVDEEDLPKGIKKYILINSAELYEKGKIYIKDTGQKLYEVEISDYDYSLLDSFIQIDKESQKNYMKYLDHAINDFTVEDNQVLVNYSSLPDEQRLSNLEMLYNDSMKRLKIFESNLAVMSKANKICINKFYSVEEALGKIKKGA